MSVSRNGRRAVLRRLLAASTLLARPAAAIAATSAAAARVDGERRAESTYATVTPKRTLRFPADEGSHPAYRIEWWYLTGWLETSAGTPLGFQATFFRTRLLPNSNNPSALTPRQIIIAHAALSDRARGRLLSAERVARAALGLAGAEEGRTNVWVDRWRLEASGDRFQLDLPTRDFALSLQLVRTQATLLQGDAGFSRKGPRADSASYYYSLPHLRASGSVSTRNGRADVKGEAWLDHEWSSSYMDERATGWDWIGLNFADGSALMAFRMRTPDGGTLYAGGTLRSASGARRTFDPEEIEWTPLRTWRSGRTGAHYPVAWRLRVGDLQLTLEPLMDDQEHDTRASVGTVYWEGAITATRNGTPVARGYLELTGYVDPLRL